MIYDALGKILGDAQDFHQKSFPLIKPIQRFVIVCLFIGMTTLIMLLRSCVEFYAHESVTKCYRLTDRMVTNGKALN
jgi:hypothetical protein